MLLIPALDLKDGKQVRRNGAASDPVAAAQAWVKAGARRLHLNDLDSAASGKPAQAALVKRIVAACPGVPVQVGGGMRSEEAVSTYIEAGADFVVLGTRAVTAPHLVNDLCLEFPGHIIVSLDTKDGKLATEGWSKFADAGVTEVAEHFQREGVAAILFNPVGAAGNGACVSAAAELARAIAIPVLVAGGVASLEDVRSLCKHAGEDLMGAVVGAALDDGLDLAQAQKLADSLAK